jgi:tellurite resistance protein
MQDHHAALIYTMVIVSAADSEMTDAELRMIGELVQYLPIFRDFDAEKLPSIAQDCAALLDDENGLKKTLQTIKNGLPPNLRETAYTFACDVAAADGTAKQEELRLLEMIRDALEIDRLSAAAIERAARARHATL